jgi:hypothetical protein
VDHNGHINLYNFTKEQSKDSLQRGINDWNSVSTSVVVNASDVNDTWWVYLYAQDPTDDNSPVYYDNVKLVEINVPGNNLVSNSGFENDFTGWVPSSYIPTQIISSASQIQDGQWHTVGITYEKPVLKLYVDGVEEAESTVYVKFNKSSEYAIGNLSRYNFSQDFEGYIDDLFVTDRTLTDTQVQQYHTDQLKTLTINGANEVECVIYEDGAYHTAGQPIAGDFEPDGDVDWADLTTLAEHWIDNDCSEPDWCTNCDIDRSGFVDFADFASFAEHWLVGTEG